VVKKHELVFRQGNRGIGSPLQVAELDFEDSWCKRLYNSPYLSSTKSFFWLVLGNRDDIQ
jgi:hypothetical protein